MNFTDLDIPIRYRTSEHDIPREFLIPVLRRAVRYKRGTGFFSASSLAEITVGLCDFIRNGGKIQIVCSPLLDKEEIEAINRGYEKREEILETAMLRELERDINDFEKDRLNLLANLIALGIIDLKVAFVKSDSGMSIYHEKTAVFIDTDENIIAYGGSMNETANGFTNNFESVFMFCSWKDNSQKEAAITIDTDFDEMWSNRTDRLIVVDFPKLVVTRLLEFRTGEIDYTLDKRQFNVSDFVKPKSAFSVPDSVKLHSYQKDALNNWKENGYRGIFDMCTGSGKTFTALACMCDLGQSLEDKLAVFIVCPYIHLVSQWEEDVINWGPHPIIAHSKASKGWEKNLLLAYKSYRKNKTPFICITTNATFSKDKIQQYITRFNDDEDVLIIVDEAHNWGSEMYSSVAPENIKYRIGLSATIKRHMDKKGSSFLQNYFGEKVISYGLEEAIRDGYLVHYEYYPIPVFLTDEECDEYEDLSRKLKRFLVEKDGKLTISEAGKSIVYKRTRLLAGAINKISLLMSLIEKYKDENNILIYCGATAVEDEEAHESDRQINVITDLLKSQMGMSVTKFTAEESLSERCNIKTYFKQGMYQAITAIKCLDEGVNIPGIKTAFILSSSKNPKEFVQRRGRLLRTSEGKDKAVIYDFITLPRELGTINQMYYETDKTIILGELSRMQEFSTLSDNPGDADSLSLEIMKSYDMYVDVDEEMKKMEDYYG